MINALEDIQTSDLVHYQEHAYILAGNFGSGLFNLETHGIKPTIVPQHLECRYRCTYEIVRASLFLTRLTLFLEKDSSTAHIAAPSILGQRPTISVINSYTRRTTFFSDSHEPFTRSTTVSLETWAFATEPSRQPVPFTGGLLLCDTLAVEERTTSVLFDNGEPALLPYRGTYLPTWYQTVYELTFEQGKLMKTTDRSPEVEAFRQITQTEPLAPSDRAKWETETKPWLSIYMNPDHLDF